MGAGVILTHPCKHALCVSACVLFLSEWSASLPVHVLYAFVGWPVSLLAGACGLEA